MVRVSSKGSGYGQFLDFAGEPFGLVDEADRTRDPVPGRQAGQPAGRRAVRGPAVRPRAVQSRGAIRVGVRGRRRSFPGLEDLSNGADERAAPTSSGVAVADNSLENRFFKITVDPQSGAVASVYDKELARRWSTATRRTS